MDFAQLDHEVLTAGSPAAEGEQIAGLIQENLTPEEQNRLKEIYPVLIEFNELMFKAETGRFPEAPGEMASINEQGVPIEQASEGRVPQDMQSEAMVPSRPIEGQVPQNAPEMMSGGGKVDRFDPEGKGYDEETYRRIGSPKFFDERTQEMHGPSASPISELIEKGVLTEEEVKKYSIPMKGSLLLKGMNHETTALELEDIKGEYTYKKMPTPLGERYIAFPVKKHYGMATGGGVAAGPIGVVDKPGADNSGVADDVPAESDGFVINAAAVRHAGLRDINDMIQDAVTYAEKQGMKLNFGKTPVDAEQILVSNGEVVIPDVIANIIGYDRLEKINNRGKKETEEKIQQQEQQPAPTRQPAQPVMQAAEGGNIEEIIGRYAGPFPAEDAAIQEEVIESTTPYSSENADYVDMDRVKQVYSLYWNPETKVKKRGQRQRDYTPGSNWMTHLDKGETYELQPGIAEAIREVMPAFDYELKEIGFYNPEALEYFAKIESKGGKDLINEKTKDYGVFQVNMANAKKYFTKDTEFRNFAKFYGKKAAALTGVSAHTLREIYLDNPDDFKELMLQSPKTNLAVGLAMTLLPNMWETERKKNLDN